MSKKAIGISRPAAPCCHRGEDRVHEGVSGAPGDLLHVFPRQALSLQLVEVLGLQLAGVGRDAQHVLHEQALALRQGQHGGIGAETVEGGLVEA
jgi:hypothetical protein